MSNKDKEYKYAVLICAAEDLLSQAVLTGDFEEDHLLYHRLNELQKAVDAFEEEPKT